MKKKRLRSGFTTGACAAASSKAAAAMILGRSVEDQVEIPFPDGSRRSFQLFRVVKDQHQVTVSVIKDAGDDPDVTNGAEIAATVCKGHQSAPHLTCVQLKNILLCGGKGVGVVTKAGLAVNPGEPAINPVPRQMILAAVQEIDRSAPLTVTIGVPKGEELAKKTLNSRLGVLGGISILGTTGIVRPVSAKAWTATISASLEVAKQAGLDQVVLSTGRSSERGAQHHLNLPEEAYAMMGDYLEFSLKEVKAKGFVKLHMAGMWAKIVKAALRIPQTHVRNGALETRHAATLLKDLGADEQLFREAAECNTAREILTRLEAHGREDLIRGVCVKAQEYCRDVSGCEVSLYLVDHKSTIIQHV